MKKFTTILLLTTILLCLAGCGKTKPVAIVNGIEITRVALDEEVEYDLAMYESRGIELTDEDIEAIEQAALERLINTVLVREAASVAGITVDSVDVEGRLADIKDSYEDAESFQSALEAAGFTLESYKEALAENLVFDAFFEQQLDFSGIEPTEEDIQTMVDLYLENNGEGEEVDEEELREYVAYALRNQAIQALRSEYIEALWQASDIQYLDF